jgi:hypothetical protein
VLDNLKDLMIGQHSHSRQMAAGRWPMKCANNAQHAMHRKLKPSSIVCGTLGSKAACIGRLLYEIRLKSVHAETLLMHMHGCIQGIRCCNCCGMILSLTPRTSAGMQCSRTQVQKWFGYAPSQQCSLVLIFMIHLGCRSQQYVCRSTHSSDVGSSYRHSDA